MFSLYRLLFILGMIIPTSIFAQTPSYLITGRPSNTSGPYTVEPGMWHIESGVSFESSQRIDQPLRFYNLSVPGIDIRTGISKDVEINMGVVEKFDFLGGFSQGGFGPVTMGLKFNVLYGEKWKPSISFVSKVALPVGDEAYRPENLSPSMKLIFAHFFSDKSVIMYNVGAFWQGNNPPRGNYTLMYAYAIQNNLSIYAEIYGGFVELKDITANLAGGIAWAPKSNWQLDVSGGIDLQNDFRQTYIALGYSLRFFTSKQE